MQKRFTILLLLFFATLISSQVLSSELSSSKQKITALKVNSKVILDGKLDEPFWKTTAITNFVQRDPDEGKPSTENTNVWVAYDNNSIYIAANLLDKNPEQIDASLTRKDNWIDSDWFIFYVDPYDDDRTGYYFGVNPGGSQMDGTLFNDSWDDDSWDGIWQAKSRINENGWSVEMKIPLSQLRFAEKDEMKWGINFQRQIKKNNEKSYFVMVPKNESGFVSRFATVEGLIGIKPKQRLEVFPYMVQKAQFLTHDANDPFYKSNQFGTNLGADFKVGLGSNFNLDVTVNPDFGQVEVDPAVVNLSAFETFFQEKRPFFIEGLNMFRVGSYANNNWGFNFGWPQIFYSRRIGRSPQGDVSEANEDYDFDDTPNETRIISAAKLTGQTDGKWKFGAISAVTARTFGNYYFEEGAREVEEEIEPLTHYGVFRATTETEDGKRGVGFMATSVNRSLGNDNLRSQFGDQSYTFGADGFTFLDDEKEYILTGTLIGSYAGGTKEYVQNLQERHYRYLQRPDAEYMKFDSSRTSLSGTYARVMLNKQKGNFYINSAVGFVTPGFEYNDLGFQWMADKINFHQVVGYRWYKPDGTFRFKRVYFAYANEHDFDGNITNNRFFMNNYFQFENYHWIWLGGGYNFKIMSRNITRGGPIAAFPKTYWVGLDYGTDSRKPVVFNIDFFYAGDDLGSNEYEVELDMEWKPSSQIYFSIGPEIEYNHEKIQYVDTFEDQYATSTYNNRYVFGEIKQTTFSANMRLNWTFTPTLSLQLFIQPLISVGDYENLKELASPRSLDYNVYGENGSTISFNNEEDEYTVDPDGDGPAEAFTFDNPNFNFKSFRANAVLRWEVIPGSIFFFAWTNNRSNDDDAGVFSFGRDFKNLWQEKSDNVFLVKYSHWLNF